MIKCLIVDDELPAREELKYIMSKNEELELIGEAASGFEAVKKASEFKPDLIFMDINMPDINGLETANMIMQLGIKSFIVFVTAYDKYALEAFDANALDYLLKPLSEERFVRCIDKIKGIVLKDTNIDRDKIDRIIKDVIKTDRIIRIVGHKDNKIVPIDTSEIIYACVEDKTTVVYTNKGRMTINIGLGELYGKLDKLVFFRTHKSFIINLNMIEDIEPWFNSTYNVKLTTIKEVIPVSRTYVKEFREILSMDM